MKRDNRKLISLIIMAILFSIKASGQTEEPNTLLGCHLQPWHINVQGDSIAVITFVQSAVLYTLDLKEQKSKLKLDLLKKAKLEKKTLCIYVKKKSEGSASIIADVAWEPTRK